MSIGDYLSLAIVIVLSGCAISVMCFVAVAIGVSLAMLVKRIGKR